MLEWGEGEGRFGAEEPTLDDCQRAADRPLRPHSPSWCERAALPSRLPPFGFCCRVYLDFGTVTRLQHFVQIQKVEDKEGGEEGRKEGREEGR